MKWILIVPAVLYLAVVGVIYVFQRSLMYAPGHTLETPAEAGVPEMVPFTAETSDGLVIESWFAASKTGQPTVVLFHGNAGTLDGRAFKARVFLDAGFGVLLAGYRGFGRNPGKPTEKGLYADARAALDYLRQYHPETGIILYGESLGTGVATHMAYEAANSADDDESLRIRGLILEAPFTSMAAASAYHYPWLPARLLVWDRFDSIEKIAAIKVPLLVLHGARDRTVPIAQGMALFEAATSVKTPVWLDAAGHVDVFDHDAGAHILEWLKNPG